MTSYELFLLLDEGLIFGLIALGVYVAFFWLRFPDLTPDGSFVLGGVLYSKASMAGMSPILAILIATGGGALAGLLTASVNKVVKIPAVVSGLIVSTALYSLNWLILSKPNQYIEPSNTLVGNITGVTGAWHLFAWLLAIWAGVGIFVIKFSSSIWGLRLRAVGENTLLARDLNISETGYTFGGLAIANGIVGLAGAMFVQRSFSADINMGLGITIAGLAGLILGLIIASRSRVISVVVISILTGGIIYKTMVFLSLRLGAPPEAFRMVSSIVLVTIFAVVGTRLVTILKGIKWT